MHPLLTAALPLLALLQLLLLLLTPLVLLLLLLAMLSPGPVAWRPPSPLNLQWGQVQLERALEQRVFSRRCLATLLQRSSW